MPTTFKFSPRAMTAPYHCAAYPQLGPEHTKGYVKLGMLSGFDTEAYVSIEALHAIAREVPEAALASKDEVAVLQAENDQLRAQTDELREQLFELEKELDHISFLKGRGYQDVKRTGRPPKKDEPTTQKAA